MFHFQLKRFVRKYAFYVTFLMSMQCMQVVIVVFGARNQDFFSYEKEDGFKRLRYVSDKNSIF